EGLMDVLEMMNMGEVFCKARIFVIQFVPLIHDKQIHHRIPPLARRTKEDDHPEYAHKHQGGIILDVQYFLRKEPDRSKEDNDADPENGGPHLLEGMSKIEDEKAIGKVDESYKCKGPEGIELNTVDGRDIGHAQCGQDLKGSKDATD